MSKRIFAAIWMATVLLTGCATEQTRVVRAGKPLPASPQTNYDIGLSNYQVNLFGKYKISHAYLSGTNITPCYVGALSSDVRFEMAHLDNGRILPAYITNWKGGNGINPMELQLEGTAKTNTVNGKVRHWMDFSSLCGSWTPGGATTLSIRNAARQTIDQYIASSIETVTEYKNGRFDTPKKVIRGKNQWMYFNSFVPLPGADTNEVWMLPIGDSGYYFYLSFAYQSAARDANAQGYQFTRRLFDQMLDSFTVEKLGPQ
jgi:hypothetical protein